MSFEKESLDLVLVPCGLIMMFVYHIVLLYRYLHYPETTVMGFENHNKRAWVERVMELNDVGNLDLPLSAISSNTSAATFLASISLTLSSLIGAWIASNNNNNVFESDLIYGDTSKTTMMLKCITLLICFFLAFSCFVQSIRSFIHANYLISMPNSNTPTYYVEVAVIRGGEFWQLGLRALYFALILLLWFFGPIPMFVSSFFMVVLLCYLDSNSTPLHYFEAPSKLRGQRSITTMVASYDN
ncbi:ABC transporter NFT1 [Bienertia sinuspersici]